MTRSNNFQLNVYAADDDPVDVANKVQLENEVFSLMIKVMMPILKEKNSTVSKDTKQES